MFSLVYHDQDFDPYLIALDWPSFFSSGGVGGLEKKVSMATE